MTMAEEEKKESAWEVQARERHEAALKVDASATLANESVKLANDAYAERHRALTGTDAAQKEWFARDIEIRKLHLENQETWNKQHLRATEATERSAAAWERIATALESIAKAGA